MNIHVFAFVCVCFIFIYITYYYGSLPEDIKPELLLCQG